MECSFRAAETAERVSGPAAALVGCSKIFGLFAALRNVTVEFAQGSCTMLLGENGAGKSTLLRLVAGLMSPSRGVCRGVWREAGGGAAEGRLHEPCADVV